MRGKGLITFFAVALILICVYQLSFNIVTSGIEKKADAFASAKVLNGKTVDQVVPANAPNVTTLKDSLEVVLRKKRQQYLDSISTQPVYNIGIASFTYENCKEQELKLGLDLQGGMNVVLQVSIVDLIKALADNSTDPNFLKALDLAQKNQENSSNADLVTLFGQAWDQVAPNGKLASIFATRNNSDKVKFNSTNQEVLTFIRSEADGAFDRTVNIMRSRIDKFGVTQPNITPQPGSGRIVVELPGVDNPERVHKLLQASAKLEFWETYDNPTFYPYLVAANTALKNHLKATDTSKASANSLASAQNASSASNANPLLTSTDTSIKKLLDTSGLSATKDTSKPDSLQAQQQDLAQQAKDNPLFAVITPNFYRDQNNNNQMALQTGPIIGFVAGKDTAKVNAYLNQDYVKSVFPRDVKILWSAKPTTPQTNVYELYAIKMPIGSDKAPLEGDKVIAARQDFDQSQKAEVSMDMNSEGARIWKVLTGKNVGKSIAIVLDNEVYSAPRVDGEIPNGRSSITGGFSVEEAKDLANVLQAGKLPAPAKIIAEDVVGPSLGQESINAGIRSIIIAFIAILVFMIWYYSTSGIIADVALFFNLFFLIGVLASRGATLTLPGIAGIVLTMGMAVDANVLIHERIKEELAKGKALAKAVHEGHVKSYSAVFDTHITTLITGLILAYFGLGPVLGYATTLNYGIILTLFCMVFLAQLMFNFFISRGRHIQFATNITKSWFKNTNFQFVKYRRYAYIFSSTIIIIGLISIFTKGFDYGVDFLGGRSYIIRFDQNVNTTQVESDLAGPLGSRPVVKTFGANNQIKITTTFKVNENNTTADSLANVALFTGLQKYLPPGISYQTFVNKYELSHQVVGPSISTDIKNHAWEAILFSILGIFLYILLRFRKWQFSFGAVVAMFHDVLIVVGIYSIFSRILPFSLEVDESFVAAALTVMGYSVNDTVIVFDRIREYLREHPGGDVKKVINDALNNTLSRTIITSSTVILVLLILFIFGGDVIRGFSFALLVGIIFGTYSSIFVATPIVIDLSGKKQRFAGTATTQPRKPVTVK